MQAAPSDELSTFGDSQCKELTRINERLDELDARQQRQLSELRDAVNAGRPRSPWRPSSPAHQHQQQEELVRVESPHDHRSAARSSRCIHVTPDVRAVKLRNAPVTLGGGAASSTFVSSDFKALYKYCIIRPHRSTTYIEAAHCYRPNSVICRSVSLSITEVSPAKPAESIEMPFGVRTRVGSRKHVRWRFRSPAERGKFKGERAARCKV